MSSDPLDSPLPPSPSISGPAYGTGRLGGTRYERQDFSKFVVTDTNIRCWKCDKLLIEIASRPWRIRCRGCRSKNQSPPYPGLED
jgi:hypothetical protein